MAGHDLDELYDCLRRVAPSACPCCQKDDWILATEPMALVPWVKGLNKGLKGGGVHAVVRTCGACGFVRLHSVQVLQAIADADRKAR